MDFAASFGIQDDDDVEVTRTRGAATAILVLDVDYEIIAANDPAGFTCRLLAPSLDGDIISGRGLAVIERTTSIVQAGQFNSRIMDRELDRSRIIDMEARRDIDDVTARFDGFTNDFSADVDQVAADRAAADIAVANALIYSGLADADRIAAENAAAAAAGATGIFTVLDLAAFFANTQFSYTAGAGLIVVADGAIIRTLKEGFAFRVRASAASDNHVATAGLVKADALPFFGAYYPEQFGALGNNIADDTAAINACWTASNTLKAYRLTTGKIYKTTDTVAALFPGHSTFNGEGAEIRYAGPRDRPALRIGNPAAQQNWGSIWLPHVYANNIFTGNATWPHNAADAVPVAADDVGVRLQNIANVRVEETLILGFSKGLQFYGAPFATAYLTVHLGDIRDCRYAIEMATAGSSSTSFCNQNWFYGGELTNGSRSNLLGDAYGVRYSWDGVASYRGQNGNIFYGTSFELGAPAGATYRTPFLYDGAGGTNEQIGGRVESCKGAYAIMKGDPAIAPFGRASNNIFRPTAMLVSGAAARIIETDGAGLNVLEPLVQQQFGIKVEWNSGLLGGKISAYSAANCYISGELFGRSTGVPTPSRLGHVNIKTLAGGEVVLPNGVNIGVKVDTRFIKKWSIRRDARVGFGGRAIVVCLDANGVQLTSAGPNHPYVMSSANSLGYNAAYGGCYIAAGDSEGENIFQLKEDVHEMWISIGGGTQSFIGKSFSLHGVLDLVDQAVGTESRLKAITVRPLDGDLNGIYAPAKPDVAGVHGRYKLGQAVNNAVAAVAGPPGWVAITNAEAYLGAAWAISTTYTPTGLIVVNGANAYKLVTAGTSAGAGGPTGTGVGIVDNTCVWDYIGPKAVFATMAVLT